MNSVFHGTTAPNILVFGDMILDHTITGSCTRLANEGPFPVLTHENETVTLGGCGNVAANLKAMGANVYICTTIGNDNIVQNLFNDPINLFASVNPFIHTTVKKRYFSNNKAIFKADSIGSIVTNDNKYQMKLSLETLFIHCKIDAVVISDYNLGVCSEELCHYIIKICKKAKIPVIVDPKVDVTKYIGATLIKPNLSEAKRITGLPNNLPMSVYHKALYKQTGSWLTVITNADEGMSMYDHALGKEMTYKVPKVEVYDVTGAGDIVCASLAYGLATGFSLQEMLKTSVFLATQSVKHPGSYVLNSDDFWALSCHLKPSKQITLNDIPFLPQSKKIVFTNGCFDLLHIGHIESLQAAKKHGDILVVGVNSDASVSKLKGPQRPIINQHIRMKMLEALECVDYVILFEEQTPANILRTLKPDVYVKGEEYKNTILFGAEYAKSVKFIPMKTNISTSMLIKSLRS
jgi:D-beta-D-heptose 7-phosphate kinase/D-beta-D-heptose 1-phosphate adenosyltransferase